MKTCVRIGSLVIALGLAGLLAGCTSHTAKSGQRARNFEIVETSTKRNLNPQEMAQLQTMVAEYLKKEGVSEGGDYYVKVFLTQDRDGIPGEWVVARYSIPTPYTATGFTLLNTYPDYRYTTYYPRYSFDYYPFGWWGFAGFGLSYYDDPFYYTGGPSYYTGRPYANHGGRWDWDRDHRRDRDHDHNPPKPRDPEPPGVGNRPPPGLKPSFKPTNGTTANRWTGNPPSGNPQTDNPNGTDNRRRGRWNDNHNNTGGTTNLTGTGTPYTPTYRPPTQTVAGNANPGGGDRSHRPRERVTTEPSRPAPDNNSSGRRETGSNERSYTPPSNPSSVKPSFRSERSEPSRQVDRPSYTPPSPPPRNDPPPAPRYDPPETRSTSQDGSHDAGRRAREE